MAQQLCEDKEFCYSDLSSSNPLVQQGTFINHTAQMFNLTTAINNNAAVWNNNVDHSSLSAQQQQILLQDGFLSATNGANIYEGHFLIKNSKFLVPAQDLLNEFCSLESETKENDVITKQKYSQKKWEEDNSSKTQFSLSSLEFVELQKRKTMLLSMLDEVDRRYKQYRNQMKGVVWSFEAVAGNGAARVYSGLALKAMSKHFRSLKDGIMDQIEGTRKAMGEKLDPHHVPSASTKGETPRLRIIDQSFRQQRAFQQIHTLETHPWRPQRGLPQRSVSLLRAWLFEHFLHPYPSDVDKHILARQTGLSRSQVSNWFINARVRLWKPMVEEMYMEEEKEQENKNENGVSEEGGNASPSVGVSSMMNNGDRKNDKRSVQNDRQMESALGSVEFDFSSYTRRINDVNKESLQGGVSLTLGLQQQGESGVSLAFYQRDQIEEPLHYSFLDADGPNMPFKNLMGLGTHLLHDLV